MRKSLVALVAVVLVMAVTGCCPLRSSSDVKVGAWGYVGGESIERAKADVAGTENDAVYLNERYGLSAYRIQIPNGTYTVRLHFAETYERIVAAGERVFTVSIEGEPVLVDFDPFKEAGDKAFTAIVKTCKAKVTDGELTIEFAEKVQNTMINGICVSMDTCICPFCGAKTILRINCGAAKDLTCGKGCTWTKDQRFVAQ